MAGLVYLWFLLPVLAILFLITYLWFRKGAYIKDLNKKAVLITGCDSGFGLNLAKRLDAVGVTVFAGCLFPDGEGAETLRRQCTKKLQIIQLDVTNDDHVEAAVSLVKNQVGEAGLWGVVNNAGIGTGGELETVGMDVVKKAFEVNTYGPLRVIKGFLPLLRKSCGRVVIVSSLAGVYPLHGVAVYSMSKFATVSLAHSFRRELKKFNISVHLVNPSAYRTNIFNVSIEEQSKDLLRKLPDEIRVLYKKLYERYEFDVMNIWTQFSNPASKVYEVVDDLVDATIGESPRSIYVPGLFGKFQQFSIHVLSIEALDWILENILRIRRVFQSSYNSKLFRQDNEK